MLAIVVIISSCAAQLTFVSPDELIPFTTSYREAPFGNPGQLLTYGKLLPFKISSDCIIPKSVEEQIRNETILVVYAARNVCEPSKIAYEAEYNDAKGVFFVWDQFDYPGNYVSVIKVYPYRGPYAYILDILCLFIDTKAGEAIQKHSDKAIFITYKMQMFAKSETLIKFYLDSNYENDYKYFKLLEVDFENNYEFSFYLLYSNSSDNRANDCYNTMDNKYYCLQSTNFIKGRDRIMNTMLMLNFFYLNKSISTFRSYIKDLNQNCSDNYSIDCNKKVIESYQAIPSLDEKILTYSYLLYEQFIPSVSSHNVFIYNPKHIKDLYYISARITYKLQNQKCDSQMLQNDRCDLVCNNSFFSYDNLNCLKDHGCFTFILGDGNCNKGCKIDPDCSSENMTFIQIILPVVVILIIAIVNILVIYFMIKKHTKPFFRIPDSVIYNHPKENEENPICTICMNSIHDKDQIILLDTTCNHFFHKECFVDWKSNNQHKVMCYQCALNAGQD